MLKTPLESLQKEGGDGNKYLQGSKLTQLLVCSTHVVIRERQRHNDGTWLNCNFTSPIIRIHIARISPCALDAGTCLRVHGDKMEQQRYLVEHEPGRTLKKKAM